MKVGYFIEKIISFNSEREHFIRKWNSVSILACSLRGVDSLGGVLLNGIGGGVQCVHTL